MAPGAKLTGAEIAKHNNKDSCWVIVHGKAYDVTEFLPGKEAPEVQTRRSLIQL
jgi:Cytochrome b involved in lipid metabolism